MALNFQNNGSASLRRVLLVVLLVVSIALLTIYSREDDQGPLHTVQSAVAGISAPFKFVGASASAGVESVGESLENVTADDGTLSGLRDTNAELTELLVQAEEYRQEAQRLEQLLGLKDSYAFDGVAARVIGRSTEAWNQTVTIDQGESAGVDSGMTVMGPSGVVGQVVSVTNGTAEVRLLTDPKSGVAALIQSSRAEGIVRGSLSGLLYLENVGLDVVVNLGDVVETSGLGGSYTKGLIIGKVVKVDSAQGGAAQSIVVSPNESTSVLEEVLVVKSAVDESTSNDATASGSN